MQNQAESQKLGTTSNYSKLDWPTPEMLQAANRARAKAFRDMTRDMILALVNWAKASIASHLTSKPSRDRAVSDPQRFAQKR
jgi:hypothetical protein